MIEQDLVVFDFVAVFLGADFNNERIGLRIALNNPEFMVERRVPINAEVFQGNPFGSVQHDGADAPVEHECRAASIECEIFKAEERKGHAFQAVVVVGHRPVGFHCVFRVEIILSFREEERDIVFSFERCNQLIDFKRDILAGHNAVVGYINRFG